MPGWVALCGTAELPIAGAGLVFFDMIAIRKSRGGFNLIDVEEFLRIPLSERVALVQQDKLRFLSGEEIVPVRGALLSLEAARRSLEVGEAPRSP